MPMGGGAASSSTSNFGVVKCPDVTIPNGAAVSQTIPKDVFGDALSITLYAPAALDGGHTYVIQVNPVSDGSGIWSNWNNGSSDVAPPAAGKATVYDFSDFAAIRIKDSTGNVGAARTWNMNKKA